MKGKLYAGVKKKPTEQELTDSYNLCYELTCILQAHAGQRGNNEGAEDTLIRIIHERDGAFTALALDRLKKL